MEHTVYLSAKAFVEEINPRTPKSTQQAKKSSIFDDDDDDQGDEEEMEEDDDLEEDGVDWTADWTYLESLGDDEEVDAVIEFLPGDVLGKVLALVNQVCSFFLGG